MTRSAKWWLPAFLPLLLLAAPRPADGQTTGESTPVRLFDGRSFNGWEGNTSNFRVAEGAIVGGSLGQKVARNEFLCTERTYGDFELRVKVKLLGGDAANAGIQFRTKRIPNHHEVSGYQADMGTGWWGALYDESRRNKVLQGPDAEKMKAVVRSGDWNDYVIRAEGKRIQLWINGVRTVDYVEADPAIETDGVICTQIHGGPPSEAWYKDITLLDLNRPAAPKKQDSSGRWVLVDEMPAADAPRMPNVSAAAASHARDPRRRVYLRP